MKSPESHKKFIFIVESFFSNNGQIALGAVFLLLIGLLIGVGLIHDVGRVFYRKTALQGVVDVSVISCGEWYFRESRNPNTNEVLDCLRTTFDYNMEKNRLIDIKEGKNASTACEEADSLGNRYIVDFDGPEPGFTITCSQEVPTLFMSKFANLRDGLSIQSSLVPSASATYALQGGNKSLFAVLVMDVSMSVDNREMERIRQAVLTVIDILDEGDYLAVTTFNQYYNGGWKHFEAGSAFGGKYAWIKNVLIPPTKITDTGKSDLNERMNTIAANYSWFRTPGTYGQGGLYFARKLIENHPTFNSEDEFTSPLQSVIFFGSDGWLTVSSARTYDQPGTRQQGAWGYKDCATDSDADCEDFFTPLEFEASGEWYGPKKYYLKNPANNYPAPLADWVPPANPNDDAGWHRTFHQRNIAGPFVSSSAPEFDPQVHPFSLTFGFDDSYFTKEYGDDGKVVSPLKLHYVPTCGGPDSGENEKFDDNTIQEDSAVAMAALEADLARNAGIGVYTFNAKLSPNDSARRTIVLQRLAADGVSQKDSFEQNEKLPSDYITQLKVSPQTDAWWAMPVGHPSAGSKIDDVNCSGYNGTDYFDYQKEIVDNPKDRYSEPRNDISEYASLFGERLKELKGGRLSK